MNCLQSANWLRNSMANILNAFLFAYEDCLELMSCLMVVSWFLMDESMGFLGSFWVYVKNLSSLIKS